ncbi:MAG: hypothetical protein KOO60_07295 [Gemmatimonadales bacterium]|nr:hypothetical protein [Gemmatimonadales bacterium]
MQNKKSVRDTFSDIAYEGRFDGDSREDGFNAEIYLGQVRFRVQVSWCDNWEHVSVSVVGNRKATPTWDEMCAIKDMIFAPDECVIQYHPPASDYVNTHPGVLHLWRPVNGEIPMPPKWMV